MPLDSRLCNGLSKKSVWLVPLASTLDKAWRLVFGWFGNKRDRRGRSLFVYLFVFGPVRSGASFGRGKCVRICLLCVRVVVLVFLAAPVAVAAMAAPTTTTTTIATRWRRSPEPAAAGNETTIKDAQSRPERGLS